MSFKKRWLVRSLVALSSMVVMFSISIAQEAKKAEEPAKAEEKQAEEKKPELPPYFGGENEKDKPPTWPDPTGNAAGKPAQPASDGKGDIPSKLTPPDLYDRIAHNAISINMVWTLIAGFLVMFMQAGFALVETGLCRAKNAGHTMSMNLMVYPLGCFAFWAYGFALGWGNWYNAPVPPGWYSTLGPGTSVLNTGVGIDPERDENGKLKLNADGQPTGVYKYGLLGTKGFFLEGLDDVSVMALFFFMMVFFDTTATIPTGAMAERWAWWNFVIYGLWVALPYCIFANWVWGGGWLAQSGVNWKLGHGAVDFAGSGVVHAMGGAIALAGALVLGPRIGKYVNGKPVAIPGHHMPMVVAGTFILAFGWFGFNPGSTLAGTDLRISVVVVNTMLAGITGAMAAMFWMKLSGQKPDTSMMCNGMLAGLVAITAPCAFVDSWAAVVIGGVAGVVVVISVYFWEKRGIDDPVGAISVHGVNGVWGVLAVGLFANGKYGDGWNGVTRTEFMEKYNGVDGVRGLFFGDKTQLMAQALDAAVVVVFGFVVAFILFKISNLFVPIRVSRETELEGLDIPEMGAHGYPDFALIPHPPGEHSVPAKTPVEAHAPMKF